MQCLKNGESHAKENGRITWETDFRLYNGAHGTCNVGACLHGQNGALSL